MELRPEGGGAQVSSNLEVAERLSEQLGNTLLLKREDMQPVSTSRLQRPSFYSSPGCPILSLLCMDSRRGMAVHLAFPCFFQAIMYPS